MSVGRSEEIVKPLRLQALTAQAFAPFGEVIEHAGEEYRHMVRGAYAYTEPTAKPAMWINRIPQYKHFALAVDSMERHPHSPQIFVPLRPGRCLAIVAVSNAEGEPDMASMKAFVTHEGQGVVYRPNVWHFAFTALDCPNDVLVLMGLTSRKDDFVVRKITPAVSVTLSSDIYS